MKSRRHTPSVVPIGSDGARPGRRRRWRWRLLAVMLLVFLFAAAGCFMFSMPGKSYRGPLPALTEAQAALRGALKDDLRCLAVDIGERNLLEEAGLRKAAEFLEGSLEEAGYETERQGFDVGGMTAQNLIVEIPGGVAKDEIVVIGGHYDTVPACPGANDNGTGAVATLALARAFSGTSPRRTLRFVLFVNEEPPYFQTASMGSLVYAKRCRARNEDVVAMLSLETIGCYSSEPDSQKYPFPINLLYPSTGNFIGFVGNLGSRRLVRQVIGSFRRHAQFPSEGAAVPSWITGVGWSDHWSFWKQGYPGVMVTDTALYRYDAYHTPVDTIEKIDFEGLARVVDGLRGVVADLAGVESEPPPALEKR